MDYIANKKVHKNLVIVLSNLNTTTCHAFIKDQVLLPPQVDMLSSFKDLEKN
jgi:hypothetical protein